MSETNVGLFDDMATAADNSALATNGNGEAQPVSESADAEANQTNSADSSSTATPAAPVETFATVPAGTVSVTEFASIVTQRMMRAKIEQGEDLDGSEYVVPQAVYQTVKAQRDRIPHVLVQGEGDKEARVYIKTDEAIVWWLARNERLASRGSGSGARASQRSAEDLLLLLGAAVHKNLYAESRLAMWTKKLEQAGNLVTKYKGFLSDASVSEETIALTIAEATSEFETEQATKEAEKAAKAKKSGETDENSDNE